MTAGTFEGIPIDPDLPLGFFSTANEDRPPEHMEWWGKPYITIDRGNWTTELQGRLWRLSWPTGARFDVYCLDGGAWDRPTWKGSYAKIEQAAAEARRILAMTDSVKTAQLKDFLAWLRSVNGEHVWPLEPVGNETDDDLVRLYLESRKAEAPPNC